MADYTLLTGFFENEGKFGKFLSTKVDRDELIRTIQSLPAGKIYMSVFDNKKREDGKIHPTHRLVAKSAEAVSPYNPVENSVPF